MSFIKNQGTSAPKKLSLDVFREKQLGEVNEVKGGSTAICVTTTTIIIAETILDRCHDE